MQAAAVEVALAYHVGHVAVPFEERTALVEIATEEGGGGYQRYAHHLGGGQPDLGVVSVADGLLQELSSHK